MRTLALLLFSVLLAAPALAQEATPPRTLSVSATDTVRVTPNRVTVRFAVVTRGQQPEPVRRENAEAAERALNAVRALGIPNRQIQLRSLRIQEDVEYRNGRRVRLGFIARRDVEVIIDDLDRLPAVVSRVVEEGANEFGGIHYDVRDRRALENEALRRAAARARGKGEPLASALGTSIRGVHAVSESGTYVPPQPPMYGRAMAMDMAVEMEQGQPDAYAAGEIEVRANVSVTFEIE
jgi:uncharacterized protein